MPGYPSVAQYADCTSGKVMFHDRGAMNVPYRSSAALNHDFAAKLCSQRGKVMG